MGYKGEFKKQLDKSIGELEKKEIPERINKDFEYEELDVGHKHLLNIRSISRGVRECR